jgi:hypothetical protein
MMNILPGIVIFKSITEAVLAGFLIESPIPDAEGFLHARTRTAAGWARALVRADA